MLFLLNDKSNVKRKFLIVHYNEIFVDNVLHKMQITIEDITRYSVNTYNDFLLIEYAGEPQPVTDHLSDSIWVVYSKMNVKDLLKSYNGFLQTHNYNIEIENNILTNGV